MLWGILQTESALSSWHRVEKPSTLLGMYFTLRRFVQRLCSRFLLVTSSTRSLALRSWGEAGGRAVSVSRLLFKVLREAQLVEAETFLCLSALLLHL